MRKFISRLKIILSANKEYIETICRKYWYVFILQFFYILLNGFSASMHSLALKGFIDSVTVNHNLRKAISFIAFMIIYILLMNALRYATHTLTLEAYANVRLKSKRSMSQLIANLKLSYFDEPQKVDVLKRAIKYAENGGEQLCDFLFGVLTNIIGIFSVILLLTPFAWWIAGFLCLLSIYRAVIDAKISKNNYELDKERTLPGRKSTYFNSILFNSKQLIDLNIYDAYEFFFGKFKENYLETVTMQRKVNQKNDFLRFLSVLSVGVQHLVLYTYIGVGLINQTVTIGEFTLFFSAVNYFNVILNNLKNSANSFIPMCLEAQNYLDFLETPDEYKYYIESDNCGAIYIDKIDSIEFRDVSFRYPNKHVDVLKKVSFSINKGEMVSIVGLNGAGKTTIIKLLLGQYSPTSGRIYINSFPLEDINKKSMWERIGTIFQQYDVYSVSAYENVTFETEKNRNIDRILSIVGIKDRFDKEIDGIHTILSRSFDENGTGLSGGERQKIALARLLYKKADLLLLDEPASALDIEAENHLYGVIEEVHRNNNDKIVLFVSHRLVSTTLADKVLFIQKNSTLVSGTHEELMSTCREYKDMVLMQTRYYRKQQLNRKEQLENEP